jgi:hypothetical protein
MINRTSCNAQKSCGLPPRPVARCQRLAIDHPIKGQAAFGNIVTAVYAAMARETTTKGATSRFRKVGPGQFASNGAA